MNDNDSRGNARPRLADEWVWLPSYAGVAFLAVAAFGLGPLGIFLALICTRAFLEVVYRLVLGSSRFLLAQQVIAFLVQALTWLAVWGLHAQLQGAV